MPRLDGPGVLHALEEKALPDRLKVLIVTGREMAAARSLGHPVPGKPFDLDDLVNAALACSPGFETLSLTFPAGICEPSLAKIASGASRIARKPRQRSVGGPGIATIGPITGCGLARRPRD